MKIVVGELQLPARVIMINKDVNDSHEEKNRVKYKPLGNKNGEDKSIFFSFVIPVGLEELSLIKNWIIG